MDVRCGACNKLFRVSDDKITGRGIKFPCTRCGEYVRITQEDLQYDTLSRSTVSVLDLFEPKPVPAAAPLAPETMASVPDQEAIASSESIAFEPAATYAPEDAREEEAPSFFEPVHAQPASVTEPEPDIEPVPEPLMQMKPETGPPVESQPGPQEEPAPLMETKAKAVPSPAPPAQSSKPGMEIPRPDASEVFTAAVRAEQERMTPSRPSYSGRLALILFGMLIVLGLAGYGVFVYLQPSPQKKVEAPAREITSIDGLQIVAPAGTMDAIGDLIVTGVIENAVDREITEWQVVLEIYDAQGVVLSKIRLLNGSQIYSRRDYDILAERGENIQELKATLLQQKGVVIPPKGRVNFEMRSVQPPAGISSFVAQVLPFDRMQMDREIAEAIK